MGLKLEKQLKLKKGDYVAIKNSGGLLLPSVRRLPQDGHHQEGRGLQRQGHRLRRRAPLRQRREYNGDQLELIE